MTRTYMLDRRDYEPVLQDLIVAFKKRLDENSFAGKFGRVHMERLPAFMETGMVLVKVHITMKYTQAYTIQNETLFTDLYRVFDIADQVPTHMLDNESWVESFCRHLDYKFIDALRNDRELLHPLMSNFSLEVVKMQKRVDLEQTEYKTIQEIRAEADAGHESGSEEVVDESDTELEEEDH